MTFIEKKIPTKFVFCMKLYSNKLHLLKIVNRKVIDLLSNLCQLTVKFWQFDFYFEIKKILLTASKLQSFVFVVIQLLVAQCCLILCNTVDCRPQVSSAHGILQISIPEWTAFHFSNLYIIHYLRIRRGLDSGLIIYSDWEQVKIRGWEPARGEAHQLMNEVLYFLLRKRRNL